MSNGPAGRLKTGPFRRHGLASAIDGSARSVDENIAHVSSEFEWDSTGILWFGDEEAVPDPFTELETDSIEDVVSDPGDKEVEHEADDEGGSDDIPV